MQKAKDVKEFVERVDASKKVNPKDLSSDQDLTIALMNLISIEEHLVFSGAKTGKTSYYDLIEDVREIRKNLMQQIIPQYEGEVWCISKHLLASSMRLMEVGTKQQSLNRPQEAYKLFDQAYELYCLFWGLNMNMLDIEGLKWVQDKPEDIQKLSEQVTAYSEMDIAIEPATPTQKEANATTDDAAPRSGFMAKMKHYVKKAVDCCIE